MKKPTFETWLEDVFGRDESTYDLYSQLPRPFSEEPSPLIFAEWLTHVYAEPAVLDRFSANEVGLAFGQTLPHIFADPNLPIEVRRRAFRALPELFSGLFTPRCSHGLCHQNEIEPDTYYLNGVCYMWWDVSPFSWTMGWVTDEDRADFLHVCRTCLSSPNPAVQESALHGLGENSPWGDERLEISELIDWYLESGLVADPRLVAYAESASLGMVQ